MKVYEVHFDHQIEGEKEGTFSTYRKALAYLVGVRGCDMDPVSAYPEHGIWNFKTEGGLYYSIKEITVS